jgi:glucose/arabinose dehydrogenase
MRILPIVLLITASSAAGQSLRLTPHKITLSNRTITLNAPEDFEIIPAAEGLKRVRFFAKAPDGRIFVTDMYNLADNKRGMIYILDGWDAAKGKFSKVIPYMTGLRNPNSVQFYRDTSAQDWIYIAETQQLTRRKFTLGETKPTDTDPQVLATFPDYGLSYKYGGWHLTRTIAFAPNGKLYISVGSSCNACMEKEKIRASVIEMNPDGTSKREIARGLRNAVGLKYMEGHLFASNQGSDHLGLQKPDETFYALNPAADTDYGWPYCHSSNGKIFDDPGFKRASGCKGVPAPYAFFPAHASALGFDYFVEAPPGYGRGAPSEGELLLRNAFVVALHGSTDKRIGHGYKIVVMRKGEPLRDLITGFLAGGVVQGRACDIMRLDNSSFLFTDDNKGVVFLVRKKGTSPEIAASPSAESSETPPSTNGEANTSPKTCLSVFLVIATALIRPFRSAHV